MRYKTGAAFRQALEVRLREQSLKTNAPLTRLRKMVAFDRFLARLVKEDSRRWIIKGGLAMQLRLGEVARTTKDIDATTGGKMKEDDATISLRKAASLDLEEWFEFEIGQPTKAATGAPESGLRFPVKCLLDGRTFENFHFDLGQGDPVLDKPEKLTGPPLLEFAGIRPSTVRCYPLTAQVAEKFHAYTRPYSGGESSRVRDLADILQIASMGSLSSYKLARAVRATFAARATHEVPEEFPKPPRKWTGPYKKLTRELSLNWSTVEKAGVAAALFLDPVLNNTAKGRWARSRWSWEE